MQSLEVAGVSLEPAKGAPPTALDAADAVRDAAGGLSFLNSAQGHVGAAVLGYLTVDSPSETATGEKAIAPVIDHRLVWFLTFEGFTAPVFGGLDSIKSGQMDVPQGHSRMWVAVDPDDGSLVRAETIDSDVAGAVLDKTPNK